MAHVAKKFDHLIGQVPGLSEKLLKAHFGLYEGYVKKLNEIEEKLPKANPATANYSFSEFSELMRRFAVPYNGAYLHELYFSNLTGKKTQPGNELKQLMDNCFGNFENWQNLAKGGLTSANGWLVLCFSRRDGLLRNCVIEEHHRSVPIDQDIILALDGWEHAYAVDYATDKAGYIKALFGALDWSVADQRFAEASRFAQKAA